MEETAESSPSAGEIKVENDSDENANTSKTLQMSFADWKKCKEALGKSNSSTTKNPDKKQNNNNNNVTRESLNGGGGRRFPNRNCGPPLPMPLMSLSFGSYGPCVPPPMPPPCNMGMGPRRKPPAFWDDKLSPHPGPPPIQPPMPKCPSLWNLVPKEKNQNRKNQYQTNKKFKTNPGEKKSSNSSQDAALMPPPSSVPPVDSSSSTSTSTNNNSNSKSNNTAKTAKKTKSGTYVQIDGEWIKKPAAPLPLDQSAPGTKEERQRQWKEYRQAMKPFKNREFHNWKRTVQRLGKMPRDQLDEKQLERLQTAEECIGAHKAMLTIKHAEHWVPQASNTNSITEQKQAQVYVRRPISTFWDKSKQSDANPFRFNNMQPMKFTNGGRAIKGGVTDGNIPPFMQRPHEQQQQQLPIGSHRQNFNTHRSFAGPDNYRSHFVKAGTLLSP